MEKVHLDAAMSLQEWLPLFWIKCIRYREEPQTLFFQSSTCLVLGLSTMDRVQPVMLLYTGSHTRAQMFRITSIQKSLCIGYTQAHIWETNSNALWNMFTHSVSNADLNSLNFSGVLCRYLYHSLRNTYYFLEQNLFETWCS